MSAAKNTLPLAVQLYSLRNMPESLDERLAKVAELGYRGVETIGTHDLSAAELGDLLEKHGLQAVSSHVSLAALTTDLNGIIRFNQTIGNNTLTISSLPEAERPGDAVGWQAVGKRLGELGAQIAAADMRLLYHNHAFEMERYDGRRAIEWMLESTEPANLGWEPDLAWIVRGEADPVALLREFAGRCPMIHVKDLHPAGEGEDEKGFADVGHGTLDWAKLLPAAKAAGAEWYIVEHDLPRDPIRTIHRSIITLQGMADRL